MHTSTDGSAGERVDYIVVGSGSAGSVLANRLSADPTRSVLVLEAGGSDRRKEITIPAAFSKLFTTDVDWNYRTEPQPGLDGRTIFWPRGKVLGGSSSLNAMMWVIGFAADYDRWAQLAGPRWSWSSLEPLFRDTLVPVSEQRDPRPQTGTLLDAVQEAGYRLEEPNLPAPDGFTRTRVTQRKGERWNAHRSYVQPVLASRPNLDVRTDAHVTRIRFDGTRAVGVEYRHGGRTRIAHASAEVILAGGAVNTPQLLLLSGIGDPEQLRALGIPVIAASPDVGRNLRDHLASLLVRHSEPGTLYSAETPAQLARYLLARKGMLTSNVAEGYGFVRSDPSLAEPDLEILVAPAAYTREGLHGIPGHGLSVGTVLLQPESRGSITLASADPFEHPVIDPAYLSDEAGADRAHMLAGLGIVDRILNSPALAGSLRPGYIAPDGGERLSPEERLVAALEQCSHTLYHPTSTARMGSDAASVVDPELRVRGVTGLRVADASVMPEIIRGHTHAPSVVIGEQAARLVLDTDPASLAHRA